MVEPKLINACDADFDEIALFQQWCFQTRSGASERTTVQTPTRDQAAERWIGGIMQSKARNFRLIARRTVLMMSRRIGRLNALLGEQAYPNKVRGVWGKMVAGERYTALPTTEEALFSYRRRAAQSLARAL